MRGIEVDKNGRRTIMWHAATADPLDRGERVSARGLPPTRERELTGNNGPVSLRSENPAEAGTQDNQGGF
jgi:hypothetical protein